MQLNVEFIPNGLSRYKYLIYHTLYFKSSHYGRSFGKSLMWVIFSYFLFSFHKTRDSLLSSASGYTNYRGVLNLCVVLLVMSTGRLVLENILKYGFLVRFDVPVLFIKDPTAWPSLLAIVCESLFVAAFMIVTKLGYLFK